jgi:hypothetical protein
MQNHTSTETQNELSKLGLYQIVGGSIGIIMVIRALFLNRGFSGSEFLIALAMIALFGYSVFCGVLCLEPRQNATTHSFINQALQLLSFSLIGYSFEYVAGVYLSIGLDFSGGADLTFGAGVSKLTIAINGEPDTTTVNINLIALLILFWLDRIIKKIKEEKAIRQDTDFL